MLRLNLILSFIWVSKIQILFDPIEQFEFYSSNVFLFDTNVTILMVNTLIMFILFYNLSRLNIIGYGMTKLLTFFKGLFFTFFTQRKHQIYFFPFFYIFVFILTNNLVGLFQYTYTLTSLFTITLFLAFIVMFGVTWIGVEQHGWKFFARFFPQGVPFIILLLLITLEAISYVVRIFSLSLRLFANMLSGHLLVKILSSFLWLGLFMVPVNGIFFLSLLFSTLIIGILLLELIIAFLQAYVFIFLSLLYLREAIL